MQSLILTELSNADHVLVPLQKQTSTTEADLSHKTDSMQ